MREKESTHTLKCPKCQKYTKTIRKTAGMYRVYKTPNSIILMCRNRSCRFRQRFEIIRGKK